MSRCSVPPNGWWCSRAPGHEGPCAARPTVTMDFCVGQPVHMDGLTDLRGYVTTVSIGERGTLYEVAWWNERSQCSAWFSPLRLEAA